MSEEKESKKLSKVELQYMKVIWNCPDGICSNEIYSKFNMAQGTKSTILHRIIKKGYVNMTRKGKHCIYTPKITQYEYEEMVKDQTLSKLDSILATFFHKKNLTEPQLDKVKRLLEELIDE